MLPMAAAAIPRPGQWDAAFYETLWQNQTQFGEMDPWNTYQSELQCDLEAAWSGGKKSITVGIKGHQFSIDFEAMTQRNVADPSKVRNIRRHKAPRCLWFLVRESVTAWSAERLPDHVTDLIESGLGERVTVDGAPCIRVKHDELKLCVDKAAMRAYVDGGDGHTRGYYTIVSLPQNLVTYLPPDYRRTRMNPTAHHYRKIVQLFENTKGSKRRMIDNDHLKVVSIDCAMQRRICMEFWQTVGLKRARNPKTRILLAFHGTTETAAERITKGNFSRRKISTNTKNDGWFGKGFYFSERAYTALGYQAGNGSTTLLASLVVVENTFECPLPDDWRNPYHGKECKAGYDSHYSPGRKELVVFSPQQILPCFLLRLNTNVIFSNSFQDYDGLQLESVADVHPWFEGTW